MSTSIPIQPQQVLPDWLSRSIVIISGHTSTETLQLPLTLTNYKGPPLAFPYTAVDSNGRGSGPTVYSVIGGSLVTVTLSLASPSTTFAPNSIPSTSVILIPSTTSATSRFSFVTSPTFTPTNTPESMFLSFSSPSTALATARACPSPTSSSATFDPTKIILGVLLALVALLLIISLFLLRRRSTASLSNIKTEKNEIYEVPETPQSEGLLKPDYDGVNVLSPGYGDRRIDQSANPTIWSPGRSRALLIPGSSERGPDSAVSQSAVSPQYRSPLPPRTPISPFSHQLPLLSPVSPIAIRSPTEMDQQDESLSGNTNQGTKLSTRMSVGTMGQKISPRRSNLTSLDSHDRDRSSSTAESELSSHFHSSESNSRGTRSAASTRDRASETSGMTGRSRERSDETGSGVGSSGRSSSRSKSLQSMKRSRMASSSIAEDEGQVPPTPPTPPTSVQER